MKLPIIAMLAAALSVLLPAPSRGETLPAYLDGRMMPYDFGAVEPFSIPDSLTVCNISYIARHGARYMTGPHKFRKLAEALRKAGSDGNLTARGEGMMALIDTVAARSAGRWGMLSEVGAMEQRRLAEELDSLLPGFFSGRKIWAWSTYVPRVIRTMQDFTYRLAELNPDMDVWTLEGPDNDEMLRFFDTDSVYHAYLERGPWRVMYDLAVEKNVGGAPAEALFRHGVPAGYLPRELTMEMYEVLSSLSAFGMEQPDDTYMTVPEFEACWRMSDYQQFLTRGFVGCRHGGARAVASLVISYLDNLLGADNLAPAPSFFFGHAETLLPFLAAIGLPDINSYDVDEVWKGWKNYELAPLGANLLTVAATSPDGTTYLAFRLNGRNVCPVPDSGQWVKADLFVQCVGFHMRDFMEHKGAGGAGSTENN